MMRGLVGWWLMNECVGKRLFDYSCSRRPGTIVIAPAGNPRYWYPKNRGQGIYIFSGSRVSIGSIQAGHLLTLAGTPFTISAWARPQAGVSAYARVVDKSTAGFGANGYGLAYGASGGWDFYCGSDGKFLDVGSASVGDWNHLCVTFDGGSFYEFWLNGARVSTVTRGSPPPNTTADLNIGDWSTSGRHFLGNIDDVRLFRRRLFTDEIKELYAGSILEIFRKTTPAWAFSPPPVGLQGGLHVGSDEVQGVYVGSTTVTRVYRGTTQVFPKY